jgi:hypothetical protein
LLRQIDQLLRLLDAAEMCDASLGDDVAGRVGAELAAGDGKGKGESRIIHFCRQTALDQPQ